MLLISVILVSILNIGLGLLVYLRNRSLKANIFFLLLSSAITGWMVFNYLADNALDITLGTIYTRILMSFGVLIVLFVFFLIYNFARVGGSKNDKLLMLFSPIGATVLLVTLFTNLVINSVNYKNNIAEIVFGDLSIVYLVYFVSFLIATLILLVLRLKAASGNDKARLNFFFLGLILSFSLVTLTNLILPLAFNVYVFSPYGVHLTLVFISLTAYAIIKHRLMDIKLILIRSLTYVILLVIFGLMYMVTIFVFGGLIFGQFTGKEAYWASMIVALLVGFTFSPLKHKFTQWTDKVFFKDRYNFESLTAQLNETSTSTIILPELLFKFLNLLIDEMRVTRGAFVLLEKGKIYESQTLGYKKTIELGQGEIEHLTKEKKIEIFDEAEEGSDCKEIMRKYDASIILPLIAEKELTGVLFLGDKKSGDAYSSKDIDVLKIVSNQLALGIQNAKAYEQAQKFNLILRAEINRATKELTDTNAKLQDLDKSKDEFISLASHEIRTPIATIEGYLSILTNQKLKQKDQLDILGRAYDSVGRLAVLAKDLLDTSRIDQERLTINKEPTRIERLIDRVIEGFEFRSKDKGIYVKQKKSGKLLPEVSLDPERISEVLNNIIGNAIKFTHKGGITVSASLKDKNTVLVSIEDTGEGVPKDDVGNIFKKFYQAQTASSILSKDKGGTGLGLYITKNIIDIHGGKIWIESRLRRGTTFFFTLPLK